MLDAEPAPFFGAEPRRRRRAFVDRFIEEPKHASDSICLGWRTPPQNLRESDRFEVLTSQGDTVFPEGPIFVATPGPATFVDDPFQ